ncbi:MAG: nucleotidyltransferase domain-containing protein [Defluviitaleaceae bacterium]|nr:nucleotidyltransferase domain-containing protein [Defluviitaleaceae bacterium]
MNEQTIQNIMTEAVEVSRKTFGAALRQVWLFGSYARKEANNDSDVDFLVVLSEPVEAWKYICTVYNDFTVEIIKRYGELPSVFIANEVDFIEEPTQLYRNVKKEGLLVYGN